jgi:tetratricopeptide (TPR) repeat protein
MVRITEVDAEGHECETKAEPKKKATALVNLSPKDAKAVAEAEEEADVCLEKEQLAQAYVPLTRALAVRERALGLFHPDLCQPLARVGGVLRATGRFEDAEKAYRRSLEIREKHDGEVLEVARTLEALGEVLRAQGNLTSAEACLREGLEKLEACQGKHDPEVGGSLINLASLLDQVGRPREALVTIQRAVHVLSTIGDERSNIARSWERHLEKKVQEDID